MEAVAAPTTAAEHVLNFVFFRLNLEAPIEINIFEVRIGTIAWACGLAIWSVRSFCWSRRRERHDTAAAYLASTLALVLFVVCSSAHTAYQYGFISTIREALYAVYNLSTMLAWTVWYLLAHRRARHGYRPKQGR